MFTGIIEHAGQLVATRPVAGGRQLVVDAGPVAADAVPGASIAINGVCLTVTSIAGTHLGFDVITESLDRTNLGRLAVGQAVNLERSLTPSTRIDGHFVQGHVDGTATVTRRVASPREWVLWLQPQGQLLPYIIPKGSVAIDGISLTIAAVDGGQFSVALIPTTLVKTTIEHRQVGDQVNIETDILARTIVHHLSGKADSAPDVTVTAATLRTHGFM